MNKQKLANKIWQTANKMRSKIEANEYKDYILGFIFYKFLSDTEIKYLKENDFTDEDIKELDESDIETVEFIQKNIGYFISYDNLYSTWLNNKEFDVNNVTDALSAFNRLISKTHKKVFEKIFNTLEAGLNKLGDSTGKRTKAISELINLIKDIPTDGKQGYDVLGYIYEYLIENFAANAGKKAGEFYTPHEVSLLMSEIIAHHLKERDEIKIYDPTSGSGSLLINIGHSAAKYINSNNIKYYAQELKENTYNLTRMNLVMRGIRPDNIVTRNGDTLEDDWPEFDEKDPINTYNPLYVDAVVSNPPYSQSWSPKDKETDARYADYGLAPKGKADYAFLLHDLYHIKPDGIMAIVLPHGVLFRGGEEGNIRKNLIENNKIETIIGLPANIFFGTGIPTIIMILRQERVETDVLIIDASKGFIKEGKNNKLRSSDIKKIVDTVIKRENIEKFSRVVTRDEIRKNDYNLNIPRYVDSSDEAESWDIYATMYGGIPKTEIEQLHQYWNVFPDLKNDLFIDSGTPYTELIKTDIKDFIINHNDIVKFKKDFDKSFDSFDVYLHDELIKNILNVNIYSEEDIITKELFNRLTELSLVDKYEAYQLLDDVWNKIAVDLEIIHTEGFEATKKVEPLMVIKKKGEKEEEIQEGYVGKIIPFDLIKQTILSDRYSAIRIKEQRIAEIPSLLEEIAESLDEEQKDKDYYCDDSFVSKEISKAIKDLKKEIKTDPTAEAKKELILLQQVEELFKEERALKKEINLDNDRLEIECKNTIEALSDEQVCKLLEMKWIDGLISNIYRLKENIINKLINEVSKLKNKYETTYFQIEEEIKKTEQELSKMIDDLIGSDYDMKGLYGFKSILDGDDNE